MNPRYIFAVSHHSYSYMVASATTFFSGRVVLLFIYGLLGLVLSWEGTLHIGLLVLALAIRVSLFSYQLRNPSQASCLKTCLFPHSYPQFPCAEMLLDVRSGYFRAPGRNFRPRTDISGPRPDISGAGRNFRPRGRIYPALVVLERSLRGRGGLLPRGSSFSPRAPQFISLSP